MSKNEIFCPLCSGLMTVIPDNRGFTVECKNECVPYCHENVFGHGRTYQEAWEAAKEKYKKPALTE